MRRGAPRGVLAAPRAAPRTRRRPDPLLPPPLPCAPTHPPCVSRRQATGEEKYKADASKYFDENADTPQTQEVGELKPLTAVLMARLDPGNAKYRKAAEAFFNQVRARGVRVCVCAWVAERVNACVRLGGRADCARMCARGWSACCRALQRGSCSPT